MWKIKHINRVVVSPLFSWSRWKWMIIDRKRGTKKKKKDMVCEWVRHQERKSSKSKRIDKKREAQNLLEDSAGETMWTRGQIEKKRTEDSEKGVWEAHHILSVLCCKLLTSDSRAARHHGNRSASSNTKSVKSKWRLESDSEGRRSCLERLCMLKCYSFPSLELKSSNTVHGIIIILDQSQHEDRYELELEAPPPNISAWPH